MIAHNAVSKSSWNSYSLQLDLMISQLLTDRSLQCLTKQCLEFHSLSKIKYSEASA